MAILREDIDCDRNAGNAETERTLPTLDKLQGGWVGGGGEVITVQGNELCMNGIWVPGGLKLSDDGLRVLGFSVYEVDSVECTDGGGAASSVAWKAAFSQIFWRRPEGEEMQERTDKMQAHMYERAATCGGQAFNVSSELEAVAKLNDLIERWRESNLVRVRSSDICPDWTNRAQTGLSPDHLHYIATLMCAEGFRCRRRGIDGAHEVPVLVRETATSSLGSAALEKWRAKVAEVPSFPPFQLNGVSEFYCSLGSGHFSQALNLIRSGSKRLWSEDCYDIGHDEALREAIDDGVESIILSREIPTEDRRFVSEFLNRTHGRRWTIGEDGRVQIDDSAGPSAVAGGQFVALSKVLDSEQLSVLVRRKLNVQVEAVEGEFVQESHAAC